MKVRVSILFMLFVLCFNTSFAQMRLIQSGKSVTEHNLRAYPLEVHYHNWLLKFTNAWNEIYQKGIKRLNNQPQEFGITPINGVLLTTETDFSFPARGGCIVPIVRFYNNKIWSADSDSVANKRGTLRNYSWMGCGWDLHFGKLWTQHDSLKVYETQDGMQTNFKHRSGSMFLSIDGNFLLLIADTIKIGDGSRMIFGFECDSIQYLTKIVSANGNITSFHYDTSHFDPFTYYPQLDSFVTSAGSKAKFYYNFHSGFHSLDSIKFNSYNNQETKIQYHYDYTAWADSTPFSDDQDDHVTFLLESAIYPNGDSIYYDYNNYLELICIHTRGGDSIFYEYETYNYYTPQLAIYPPTDQVDCNWAKQYTRGIKKRIIGGPWISSDTTIYSRVFRYHVTQTKIEKAITNADSINVIYPEGNYDIFLYRAGLRDSNKVTHEWGITKGLKYYGILDSIVFYDKTNNILKQFYQGPFATQRISGDSIQVVKDVRYTDGVNLYKTKYHLYDNYGNPRLIHNYGDSAVVTDDRWLHLEYAHRDSNYTFWLKTWAHIDEPPQTSHSAFSSLQGVDTLKIKKKWGTSIGNWNESKTKDTIITYSPGYRDTISLNLTYTDDDTIAKVTVRAKEFQGPDSLKAWAIYDLKNGILLQGDSAFKKRQNYLEKYLTKLVTTEKICSDSIGATVLRKTKFSYDFNDSGYIAIGYSTPNYWVTPPNPSNVRGNLTSVERWKSSNNYTNTQYRYDTLGNVVQTILYPNNNVAETTFTYFAPLDTADRYQYAFPWRVVIHPDSSSNDSLCSRTEYDRWTGLITREIDESNSDSIRFDYDKMNRLKKIWVRNNILSKKITYNDMENPEAITDSVKQVFTGEVFRWIVTKTFFDSFGRLIQLKLLDPDNSRTIIQNVSYNGNGFIDSISNPYDTSGTQLNYYTPDWSQVTSIEYDGLNRISKVTHPDSKFISVKYYGDIDTIYDEENNKTIYKRNSFGLLDTVLGAENDTIVYEYDRMAQLIKVKDAEGKESNYYYDNLGRIIKLNCPDMIWRYVGGDSIDMIYEYDDLDKLTRKKDTSGIVDYEYDNINRLTKIKFSSDSTTWNDKIRLTWDVTIGIPPLGLNNPKGRLGKIVTCNIDSTKYFYDDRGRLSLKRINIVGMSGEKSVTYKYNYANQCTLIYLTPSQKVIYQYNRLGQIKAIPGLVSTFKYNPAGQVTKINYSNGAIDTISYDIRFRPTVLRVFRPFDIGDKMKLSYYYKGNNNVDSIIDYVNSSWSQKFGYDNLNRLISVTCSSGNQSFTYYKDGNRKTKNGSNYNYYNNTNRLYHDALKNHKYYYDAMGSLIERRNASDTTQVIDEFKYSWDNRLVYYKKGQDTMTFAYNAVGLRVKKHYYNSIMANDTSYYIYDGISPIVEYSSGGSIRSRYIYAGGLHIARIMGADTHYYHCDALGTPRKMTKENGSICWSATYYPFGEMTKQSGLGYTTNSHGFIGKEYDESNLNYFCQRYYNSETGKFITTDFIPTPTFSPYSYCLNNPLRYKDVDGAIIIHSRISDKDWKMFLEAARKYMGPQFDILLDCPDYYLFIQRNPFGGENKPGGFLAASSNIGYLFVQPSAYETGIFNGLSFESIVCHEVWHAYFAHMAMMGYITFDCLFSEHEFIYKWMMGSGREWITWENWWDKIRPTLGREKYKAPSGKPRSKNGGKKSIYNKMPREILQEELEGDFPGRHGPGFWLDPMYGKLGPIYIT